MNIVLIEDNPGDIQILEILLGELQPDHKLTVLKNSSDAFDYLKSADYNHSSRPDLIIIDMILPKIPGINLINFIRSGTVLNKCPVFMLTTVDNPQIKNMAMEMGADGYFVKPLSIDEYITILQEMFTMVNNRIEH